jgi:hypothetical protein
MKTLFKQVKELANQALAGNYSETESRNQLNIACKTFISGLENRNSLYDEYVLLRLLVINIVIKMARLKRKTTLDLNPNQFDTQLKIAMDNIAAGKTKVYAV